ncbi:MAG: hypothetical protein ABI047_04880 [Jatrophihabitantaceae bacterium]
MTRYRPYLAILSSATAALLATTALSLAAGPAQAGEPMTGQVRTATPATAAIAGPALAAAPATTPATTAYADWPAYHGNGARSGYAITAKRDNVQPTLGWSIPLDGAV